MAITAEEARAELRRRKAIAELERRKISAAGPALPDPMSAEGLALQGSSTSPAQARAAASPGPPTDVPELPGEVAPPSRLPQHIGRQAMPQTMNKLMEERGLDYVGRAATAFGTGPMALYQGAKQLTGLGDQEQNERDIRTWRALQRSAGKGTGNIEGLPDAGNMGRILSDVATMALPFSAAESAAVKIGSKVLPAPAAKVAAASGVGGTEGGIQPVLPGESRATNIALGAGVPAALSSTVQAGRRATTGMFDTSDAAARLETDTGVTLSIGQAIEGGVPAKIIKNIEDYSEGLLPGVSGARIRSKQEAFDTLGLDASPASLKLDGEYLTDIVNEHRVGSPEYFNTLRDQFDAAYNKLLKDVEIEAPGIISLVDEALEAAGTEFDAPLRARLRKSLLEGIPEEGVDMVTGRQLKKIMSDAADGVSKATLGGDAGKNMSAIAMYNAVRDSLSDLLGKRVGTDKVAALRQLDDAYAHRQVLELTASNVFGQSPGVLTPQGLSGAVSARSTPSMLANQTGTAAELSADMTTAMVSPKDAMWARAAAGTGIAPQNDLLRKSAAVVAGGILAPITIGGTTIRGSKFLRGQLGNQQAIAKAMREIIEPKIGTGTVLISNYEE